MHPHPRLPLAIPTHTKAKHRELKREKVWARINLVPLLQAELDRDHVRRLEAVRARESTAMAGVPGWRAGDLHAPAPGVGRGGVADAAAAEPVYHTPRWVHASVLSGEVEGENTIRAQWWRGSKFFMKVPSLLFLSLLLALLLMSPCSSLQTRSLKAKAICRGGSRTPSTTSAPTLPRPRPSAAASRPSRRADASP